MAQITIKGWMYFDPSSDDKSGLGMYRFFRGERKDDFAGYLPICEHTLTFDDGGFDPLPALVKALQEQERDLNAKFAVAVTEIHRQISQRLAIFHTEAA